MQKSYMVSPSSFFTFGVKLFLRSISNHVLENFGLLFDIVQISFTIKNGLCIYYLNIKLVIIILPLFQFLSLARIPRSLF
jgi:hypothetical protein